MRIIAGDLKGREVQIPRQSRIRPATGFIRELAMNLFTPGRIEGGMFLDLCAGSGLVGFEAISRGAARAYFVEADSRTASEIKLAAERFGVADRAVVLTQDARRCFPRLLKLLAGAGFDAAFLDPPFIPGMAGDILKYVGQSAKILNPEALLITRSPDRLSTEVPGLTFIERRGTGNGALWLFKGALKEQAS